MAADRRFVERRRYDIKTLWGHHHEIIRQIVLGRGNKEIAEQVNVTPQTVSNVRNNPIAKQRIEVLQGERDQVTVDIMRSMQQFAPVAAEFLEKLVRGDFPDAPLALRARYADKHLGRVGYGEIKKVHSLHGQITPDDIEEIKQRARQAAIDAGVIVVDAESTVIS